MTSTPARRAKLVGREKELERLRQLLVLALGGRGRVAVVRGEAGIGKSRLVEELCCEAASRGAIVRVGRAREPEQTRPFGPAADALGVTLGAADPALSGLAREIYGRPEAPKTTLQVVPVVEHYLVERMVGALEVICNAGPLVLGIENLHWVDSSTLRFLGRVLELCEQYPVLVLLTTRPSERPEVEAVPELARVRGATVTELGALGPEAVFSLAAQLAGGAPGARLQARLAGAAGNPFFITELVSALLMGGFVSLGPDGQAEVRQGSAPTALSAAVLYKLSVLGAGTIELLRKAALLGPVVQLSELAEWTGQSVVGLAGALREGARAGLVKTEGHELVFRHELVHEALYHDWPPPLRKALHRELGYMLAEVGAPSYRVAYHLAAGAEGEDEEASGWLYRAGLEVAPRSPLEGAQLLARAVALAPPRSQALDRLRADLAVALVWAGKVEEGEGVARAVVAGTADAEVRGRAAWWLSFSLLNRYRGPEARAVCLAALGAGVSPESTRLLLELSEVTAAMMSGALPGGAESALDRMQCLAAEAERLGDRRAQCYCLAGVVMAEANEGRFAEATASGAQAVRGAELLPPAEMAMAPPHIAYAWVLEEHDRFDDAITVLGRREQLAGPLPLSSGAALSATLTARVHFAAGRWDEAVTVLDHALAWRYSAGSADMLVIRASIELHRDQLEQARHDLDLVDEVLTSGGGCSCLDYLTCLRAFLLESDGQSEKALEQLCWLWEIGETVPMAMAKPKIGPQLARLSMELGDPAMASAVACSLETLAAANPTVARLAGAAKWARGIASADDGTLCDAVELYRRSGRPLESGLVCEDAAAASAVAGSLDGARALLSEALQHFDRLLASHRGAASRARLRALGVQVGARGPRGRPTSGWQALTGTEQRVVRLVAEHLSNPEIAERLFVSRRTVETHVSNALAKMGCASRRELGVALREHERPPVGQHR